LEKFWSLPLRDRLNLGITALLGLFLVSSPIIYPPDKFENLVPAEGPLLSYSLYRMKSRHPDTVAVFKLDGYPGRFWNDELKNGLISRLDGKIGATIRVMYQPHDRFSPIDGDAVKSYGLSIDGDKFASPEDTINLDRGLAFWVIPPMGVAMLGLARWQYRRVLKKRNLAGPT
jgi:hypothetical protein